MAEKVKKGTNQFERMGHTDGPYGNSPSIPTKVKGDPPKDLKP